MAEKPIWRTKLGDGVNAVLSFMQREKSSCVISVKRRSANVYEYSFDLVKIIDGDTVDVDLDLGFSVVLKKQRIRLYGINTPESRTRDLEEKKYGLAAKARLRELLSADGNLTLKTAIDKKARGKYGRILGTLFVGGKNINDTLVKEGHAVEYFGGKKQTTKWWQPASNSS